MFRRSITYSWLTALLWLAFLSSASAQQAYQWTILTPENDPRDADEKGYDDFDIATNVMEMSENEPIFHHELFLGRTSIAHLLSAGTPFCQLRFDAVKPMTLTNQEKQILTEYFRRGGFLLLQEDCYPYNEDEFWPVKSWPIIDFLTRELPSASSDFTVTRVTDDHAIFHQVYRTVTAEAMRHELMDNPNTPNRTLLSWRGHPCAFVYGRYNLIEDGKWTAMPRPFERVFSLDPRGYKLTVNLYVYATTH